MKERFQERELPGGVQGIMGDITPPRNVKGLSVETRR